VREHGSLRDADLDVDLDTEWEWPPGHPEAARKILSDDGRIVHLRDLLNAQGVHIRGITATQLDDIASVLADGIEDGKSPKQIASALRGVLRDPKRTERIAVTEVNRAVSAATLEAYRRDGVPAKGWLTAMDQRVCPICKANEEAGPIGLDENFPSGDPHPPNHPWDRCALIPEWPDDEAMDVEKAADGDENALKHYWTRGEGLAKWRTSPHPWTALYHHLVKHMPPEKAKRVASQWFHDVMGIWPGERGGKNPAGPG
jgi:SPP1 gp7 family putative phage head morphogenesis protein